MTLRTGLPLVALSVLAACGGGTSGDTAAVEPGSLPGDSTAPGASASLQEPPQAPLVAPLDPLTTSAVYQVTLENLWGADEFPQEFPGEAHLSLVAGALHGADTVFWAFGGQISRGMEDIAEAGLIDIFLYDEVVPAIRAGQASALVEYREYTDPMVAGIPGVSRFEIEALAGWPQLTLATMLGPSPDWFVGVSGLSLQGTDGWLESIVVDLPLLDGGSKSDIVPVMGGPDIIPPEPIGYVAYDPATGTYLPSTTPQTMARLGLKRLR